MERKAQIFAGEAHDGQMYGAFPYTHHLAAVAALAKEYKASPAVCTAAWLHDTLEDTEVSELTLLEEFGPEVTDLVTAVTNALGTRKERARATYIKIRKAGSSAVLLKLLDRLANVSAAPGYLLKMYRGEWPLFKKLLCVEGEHTSLWEVLTEYMENEK